MRRIARLHYHRARLLYRHHRRGHDLWIHLVQEGLIGWVFSDLPHKLLNHLTTPLRIALQLAQGSLEMAVCRQLPLQHLGAHDHAGKYVREPVKQVAAIVAGDLWTATAASVAFLAACTSSIELICRCAIRDTAKTCSGIIAGQAGTLQRVLRFPHSAGRPSRPPSHEAGSLRLCIFALPLVPAHGFRPPFDRSTHLKSTAAAKRSAFAKHKISLLLRRSK
jgi:hypothetical protein